MRLFRTRPVVVDEITPDRLAGDTTPSLFVFGQLSLPAGYADYRRTATQMSGIISDVGFSDGWQQPLRAIDNRTYDFSKTMYVYDRFLSFTVDRAVRSVARITISEDYVRDDQIRSDIGYTGFRLSVALREETFRLLQDHLDQPSDDEDPFTAEHFRRLALRIPTRPFEFPPTRGNPDPWGSGEAIDRLERIRDFRADRIEVTLMNRKPLEPAPTEGSLHERYARWLGPTIALRLD